MTIELTGVSRVRARKFHDIPDPLPRRGDRFGCARAPAAAQYGYQQPYQQPYAQPAYPGYAQPGYAYGQQGYAQNPVGAIIDQLLGNRYNVTDRQAVSRCASAVMTQASSQYGNGNNNGYGHNGYNRGYSDLRVTGISDVQRRGSGLRVTGTLAPPAAAATAASMATSMAAATATSASAATSPTTAP